MNATDTMPLTDRLGLTLDGLFRAVAARIAGGAMLASMILLICGRVRRIETTIQRLLVRFRAGRLLVRTGQAGRGGGGRRASAVRLPRGFGWLLGLVPQHAAGYAGQLRSVLVEPEMVALLGASAQARRVLAPLCRMLGIEAEMLRHPPGEAAAPRAVAVPATRVRKARAKVDWGRIPLPRGVLTWARREGFGKPPRA